VSSKTVAQLATPTDAIEMTGDSYYGIHVCSIGEEGEYIVAAGHLDERQFLAACCKYSRKEEGLLNPWDSCSMTADDAIGCVSHVMASFDPEPADRDASWSVWWNEEAPQPRYPLTILDRL
jgi:hypothetical protein